MAPSIEPFPASELPERVQVTMKHRLRKDKIDLHECELLEMLQYDCAVENGGRTRASRVVCRPVERLFRRCQDRNGTFTVETTAWEGSNGKS